MLSHLHDTRTRSSLLSSLTHIMYRQLVVHLAIVLVLLNVYCSSSPVPPTAEEQQAPPPSIVDDLDRKHIPKIYLDLLEPVMTDRKDLLYYLAILCAVYGDCDDQDRAHKRLASNLFHGIPKFGKRAFTSAFSGIPKFG